ncbi:MAG: glycosyltransferase [Candidatus Bilamarchaeaceae archaeon]
MDLIELLNYALAFMAVYVVIFYFLLLFIYKKQYDEEPRAIKWTPKVSVVIPAYNEEEHIEKCIQSILSLDYPKDKLEVLVIDDGSTDKTAEIARKFVSNGVKVFRKENGGKGRALNYGIQRANGEFIITMDADSYVCPHTLRQLLPYFKDKEVMAVTPAIKIEPSNSLIKELQRIEYLMIIFSRKLLSFIDAVPVTPGPFSMFRAKVFREIGGFDEDNLVEDQEIALRMQAHHYKIRSSVNADVYTSPPTTFSELLRQRVRWQRGGVRNYWKYRFMIRPEYGDFGMFFIPLNFLTLAAFFVVLGLMINAVFSTPYYIKYILIESIGLSIDELTIPLFFAGAASVAWLFLVIKCFEKERVGLLPLAVYYLFYWYLMLWYNLIMVYQELKGEKKAW